MTAEGLAAGELHIWQATLDVGRDQADRLCEVLSEDERARAALARFERERIRYIAGRAQLRMLLAEYIGTAPQELTFRYGENGKPTLPPPAPHFNLSHSGGLALYAITADAEVGIDVELYDPELIGGRVPERLFAPDEVLALRALPEHLQPRGFLELWTRKEAFLKARGDGLTLALNSFSVALGQDDVSLVRTAWSEDEPDQWSLLDLSDKDGAFTAAVAARIEGWSVVRYRARAFQSQSGQWPISPGSA